MKGQQVEFQLSPVFFDSKPLYHFKNPFLNFYGYLKFEENQLMKIIYPLQTGFDYDYLKLISDSYINNQKYYYSNLLPQSPGFFYYDNSSFSYDSVYILLILEIILKRAFGNSFISLDPSTYIEGIINGNIQQIYANRNIKNFTFSMNNGTDRNNPNIVYSNRFIRIQAKFNSMQRMLTQKIYIFKDDFSLYYAHQNPNINIYFYYNNNSNWEYVSMDHEISSILYSNLHSSLIWPAKEPL